MIFRGTIAQLADALLMPKEKVYGLTVYLEATGQARAVGFDRGNPPVGKGAKVLEIRFPVSVTIGPRQTAQDAENEAQPATDTISSWAAKAHPDDTTDDDHYDF